MLILAVVYILSPRNTETNNIEKNIKEYENNKNKNNG